MNHPYLEDTIAAIATPNGVGAISVIRISGSNAASVANKIFKGKVGLSAMKANSVHHGKIVNEQGEFIDDVLLTLFKHPNSYTGEDVVEISYHGSPLIGQKIMELLLKQEVRAAEPGEFTKRAFLNNKLDLAQAEAVIDIISSRTDASLRGARDQLDGLLSKNVTELRKSLLDTLSFLELELDFAEEELEFVAKEELLEKINNIINSIEGLLASYNFGKVIRDGVNVAIVGAPNAGKSSLLNYLLKESRAIVSSIPGTTRDIIREEMTYDGILFKLFDTAGLRASEDLIEREGIRRSNETIKNADLVIFLSDVEHGFDSAIFADLLNLVNRNKIIKVMNKIDLKKLHVNDDEIKISALTGEGISNLLKSMKFSATKNANYSEKSAIVSNVRHYNCLRRAKESLNKAANSINQKFSLEFISLDLRSTIDSLGEIIGTVTTDDVLNNIFSKFCIGK
ncbi:MAG: tRNA uridine-5-carboxymethylaminomethyl(34) synthesis GTPase MnmE [Ignavibacteriaceae bacterium]|nr:tRNA uridine-5-carboxymethylaminomethyl(34) synthesis GTPase MnmE [Ignavibacteriaceae bacterium]